MTDAVVIVLSIVGTAFLVVSSIGVLRLPDVFTRMHAAGKAATIGVGCLLVASGVLFRTPSSWLHPLIALVLFFITAPIATTALSRAAYDVLVRRRPDRVLTEMPEPTGRRRGPRAAKDWARPEIILLHDELNPDRRPTDGP